MSNEDQPMPKYGAQPDLKIRADVPIHTGLKQGLEELFDFPVQTEVVSIETPARPHRINLQRGGREGM